MNGKLVYFLFYFLQMTWGIIQNVLGFLLFLFLYLKDPKRKIFRYRGAIVSMWKNRSSCSLGVFVFLSTNDQRVLVHEYGHCIQSIILGPLYMFVIGIPSFIWCNAPAMRRLRRKKGRRYSSFYTEKWANRLAKKHTGEDSLNY